MRMHECNAVNTLTGLLFSVSKSMGEEHENLISIFLKDNAGDCDFEIF